MNKAGYMYCSCGECFEIIISDEPLGICNACGDAGCEVGSGSSCKAEHEDSE